MHHADITAALIKRGSSQTQIAKEHGCSRSLVSEVIRNKKRSRGVAKLIAKATGMSPNELWPGEYEDVQTAR